MQLHNGPSNLLNGRQDNSGHNIASMRYHNSQSHEVQSTFNSMLKITNASAEAVAASEKKLLLAGQVARVSGHLHILWTDTL